MILLVDNYDSFTYNLAQYLGELGAGVRVERNDALTLDDIADMRPSHIVISPGPGHPNEAGLSIPIMKRFGPTTPILGVCLGHQAMGVAFGGQVVRGSSPVHGKASRVTHDGKGVFAGLDSPMVVGRYHSLVVSPDGFPVELEVAARLEGGNTIMAMRHQQWPVHGVQFHPESVMTTDGHKMLSNFLAL